MQVEGILLRWQALFFVHCAGRRARYPDDNIRQQIPPIDLKVQSTESNGDCSVALVFAPLKKLAKTFRKGINTFVVQVGAAETEVVLEIEL